jgi:protein-S-isoprenylcysteine O-methyltransferase Ste14
MSLRAIMLIVWGVFWIYWLLSALGAKEGIRSGRVRPPGLVVLLGFVLIRVFAPRTLAVHVVALQVAGVALFACGLGVAVWARIYLGRNWGMPMTQKREPELVTSGPYRFVRHPIYSGILLGLLGTALATNVYWLIAFGVCLGYFAYSARVEEENLANTFPTGYPDYRTGTKMLIPFVL